VTWKKWKIKLFLSLEITYFYEFFIFENEKAICLFYLLSPFIFPGTLKKRKNLLQSG